jgi:hypothetical protein
MLQGWRPQYLKENDLVEAWIRSAGLGVKRNRVAATAGRT